MRALQTYMLSLANILCHIKLLSHLSCFMMNKCFVMDLFDATESGSV